MQASRLSPDILCCWQCLSSCAFLRIISGLPVSRCLPALCCHACSTGLQQSPAREWPLLLTNDAISA